MSEKAEEMRSHPGGEPNFQYPMMTQEVEAIKNRFKEFKFMSSEEKVAIIESVRKEILSQFPQLETGMG